MRAYHNSRLSEYRKPFGAINTGGTVSLSIDLFEESGAEIVLRTWVDGDTNNKLDKWFKDYREDFL